MKYHRHQGVIEKDKKGHKKLWVGFFATIAIVAYGGFLFVTTLLNGWPIESYDKTAQIIKTTKPGQDGNKLYIPVINMRSVIGESITQAGRVGEQLKLSGNKLAPGLTPTSIRQASPFYNLDQLKEGDQVFLDNNGVRYAYEVVNVTDEDNKLTMTNGEVTRVAKVVGKISWQDGKPVLESL
jgi:hypothetical protein